MSRIQFEGQWYLPVHVDAQLVDLNKEHVCRVTKHSSITEVDENTYLKLVDCNFKNGIIEVDVLSRLLDNAPDFARGFVGIAFRIQEDDRAFESLYIRPSNGRAPQQIRRNHSTQYFSYPEYKFDRLRKESPEMYESYADMGLNEWIHIKIEVNNLSAQLTLNHAAYPCLMIDDLKHGSNFEGSVGLWTEIGTEAFFKNLKVFHQ